MQFHGACHCGGIRFVLTWPAAPQPLPARRCGCSFCQKHGAAWTSHPTARLEVQWRDPARVTAYAFGTRTARFHLCQDCGVVPLVSCDIDGRSHAVVNALTLDGSPPLDLSALAGSLDQEDLATRLARRARNWIPEVRFTTGP